MPFRRSIALFKSSGGPISLAYKYRVESGKINLDQNQLSLSAALDSLYSNLTSPNNDRFLIPDDQLDHAAQYYGGSSKLTMLNFADVTLAKVHSLIYSPPKGVYIHGSVGVGKSMLMDLFYETCKSGFASDTVQYHPIKRKCLRCHFHEFMLDVHQRIHAYKKVHPRDDPIPPVAAALAKEARV